MLRQAAKPIGGVPCSIERSRSGNGAHVWIFFEAPVLAVKARRLGNAILTEAMNSRTAHVEILASLLKPHCQNVITLVGSESIREKRQKMECLQSIPSTEPLVIVATGKYVGEGFDYARLDTLFLVSPVAWKGIVAQYAGRLHREFDKVLISSVYWVLTSRIQEKSVILHQNRNTLCHARPTE